MLPWEGYTVKTCDATAFVAANDGPLDGTMVINRLVCALERHGFTVEAERPRFCDGFPDMPCIPTFMMQGNDDDQARLTDLIIRFYSDRPMPEDALPDTKLTIGPNTKDIKIEPAFDQDIERELEFDFELTFDGAHFVAQMPIELFKLTDDLGRTIEQRYYRKIDRFADYLLTHPRS